MHSYTGRFSGIELNFFFRHANTARHYGSDLKERVPLYQGEDFSKGGITVPEEDVLAWTSQWKITDYSYGEYVLSCSYACDELMKKDRLVFHGGAYLWNGGAYIFTAPSGTGKTTQLLLWQKLYSDEMEILNGDKPILEVREREVLVHPSPWKGKEDLGRDDCIVPLKGIVLLKQAKENRIRRMTQSEAIKNLFGRIYSTFNTEEEVRNAGRLLERILTMNITVWYLENRGDDASARLTYDTLCRG